MKKIKHKVNNNQKISENLIEEKKVSKDVKRQMRFTVISIIVVTIIMISSSYAIFSDIQHQDTDNALTVGKLKVDFIDTEEGMGNVINLNGAYPISDESGLSTSPYTFKITNRGSLDAKYKVKILDDMNVINEDGCADKLLPKNKIRVSVNGGTPFTLSDKEVVAFAVDENTLLKNESKTYQIRIWISDTAGNEVLGKHYHGKIVIESENLVVNENIDKAYVYDDTNEDTKCITGEEATCKVTRCYENRYESSCTPGTIVRYKVSNTNNDANDYKYFYVLHDSARTMTMQQRENTVYNTSWGGSGTTGPTNVLSALEEATSGWTNVNDQTYAMGTTVFKTNAYTGCTNEECNSNKYTLDAHTSKIRVITMQEAFALGCTSENKSCPVWMYNYLEDCTSFGGTVNDKPSENRNLGYWTMSAFSSSDSDAWYIYLKGNFEYYGYVWSNALGARAVVEVNK